MARFLIQTTHTPEQCLAALDELVAMGPGEIEKWDLGCAIGDHSNHTAYRAIEAGDSAAAKNTVPPSGRAHAQVIEVGNFTAEQVRSFHQ